MRIFIKHFPLILVVTSFNSYALQCGIGEEEVSGVCVSSCKIYQGSSRSLTYESLTWGDSPTGFCVAIPATGAACAMSGGAVAINLGGSTKWQKDFTFTGSTCAFNEINRFSGDTAEPMPDTTGDLNQNGIPDAEEDFDGDGIINSEDTTPFQNDDISGAIDLNGNNIPDNLESIYDKLNTNTPEIVKCDNSDGECTRFSTVLREMAVNNRELAKIISNSSVSGLTTDSLKYHMERLKKHDYDQAEFTRHQVDLMRNRLEYDLGRANDNIYDVEKSVRNLNPKFANINDNLDAHAAEISENFRQVKGVTNSNLSYAQDIYSNTNNLKTGMSEVQSRTDDILNLLNENGGSSGLTDTQIKQLRNAAKANANNKLLREQKSKMESLETALSNTSTIVSDLEYGVYEALYELPDYTAKSVETTLAPRFDSLDSAIASLSSASSSIDLSGVESSLDSLSNKIDGIESGDMSGIEGKLTDLIDGVTNDNPFVEPNYDFDGEGFLINQNEVAKAQEEVLELKEDISKQLEKFKTLFSIDTSSFNNGTFKEHNLNLYIEGQERSFKSGVLSALLDNAAIISSVIMLLFVISGIKMLGRD